MVGACFEVWWFSLSLVVIVIPILVVPYLTTYQFYDFNYSGLKGNMAMTIRKRDMGTVDSKQSGPFRILLLRNPPLNTLSQGLCRALIKEIKTAERDDCVKGIILMGHGNHFSAGHDIMEFKEMESGSRPKSPSERDVISVLDSCPLPTIAAIKGVALGGGCELSLGCDFRVVDGTAQIGLPEITMGLIPGAGGTQMLPRLIPVDKALKMIMYGTPVRAKEALSMGLVDKVASTGLNLATVIQLASELLQSTPRHARHRLNACPPRFVNINFREISDFLSIVLSFSILRF